MLGSLWAGDDSLLVLGSSESNEPLLGEVLVSLTDDFLFFAPRLT